MGPRHFHFHPNGRWFYSIQEEGSTVVLFDYDAPTGKLVSRQTISTLPARFRAATSAPRSYFHPMAGFCMLATACTTASQSSPSVPTGR
jgi:6-phosphogluconolactonase (cycloisomerase 2 family)